MVIVKLKGGLGNQLFQYAAGRRLAININTNLKFDISYFGNNERAYKLSNFNVSEDFASISELNKFNSPRKNSFLNKIYNFITSDKLHKEPSIIKERFYHFDPEILEASGDVYLDGYWQSQKYFLSIENVIRSELTPSQELSTESLTLSKTIKQRESISIHIRRGDYVTNIKSNQYHGTCSIDYYIKSINVLANAITNPCFFVFSDDIEWSRENLQLDYPFTFIAHNGENRDYEDLYLMSQCKHHIIANSSFSWWGAWLCSNPQKKVIAPQNWFNRSSNITSDLIPPDWQRI